jgi:hypothetical protein
MLNRRPDDELLAAVLAGTKDCPPLEDLERLLNEEAPWPLKQHVDGCTRCQTELQMLRAFTASEVAEHEKAAVSSIAARLQSRSSEIITSRPAVDERQSWWQLILAMRWMTPAAATVAIALLVAGVAIELRQGRQPLLNTRLGRTEIMRSSSIAILSPVGDLREKPREIRWEAAPNSTRYQIRIMEVDRAELWSGQTTGTRIEVPARVETLIVPWKTLLVQAEAFDADGRKIAESEPVRFRFLQKVYKQ